MELEPSEKEKRQAEKVAQILHTAIEPGVAFVLITSKPRPGEKGMDTFVISNVPTDESSHLMRSALAKQHSGMPWTKELDHE